MLALPNLNGDYLSDALAALVGGLGGSAFAAAGERAAEGWDCRNDLEVRCGAGGCEVEPRDGFTPMSVHFDGRKIEAREPSSKM